MTTTMPGADNIPSATTKKRERLRGALAARGKRSPSQPMRRNHPSRWSGTRLLVPPKLNHPAQTQPSKQVGCSARFPDCQLMLDRPPRFAAGPLCRSVLCCGQPITSCAGPSPDHSRSRAISVSGGREKEIKRCEEGRGQGERRALLTLVPLPFPYGLSWEGSGRSVVVVARFVGPRLRRAGVRRYPFCVRAAASISRNPRGPLSGAPDELCSFRVFIPCGPLCQVERM